MCTHHQIERNIEYRMLDTHTFFFWFGKNCFFVARKIAHIRMQPKSLRIKNSKDLNG